LWSPSQAAAQRAARRRSSFYSSINLWPFVGVMIVLLVVFMTNTIPLHRHIWAAVDLPRSLHATAQPHALREDAMRVSISRDGRVFFRDLRVLPEALPDLVHDALREGAEKKVYLAADTRSKYGDTVKVVDLLRLGGIDRICFIAEKSAR